MTPTTGYRFTLPPDDPLTRCDSNSFGIEPCGVNSRGKVVKTGKALLRIVIWNAYSHARSLAYETAVAISDHLNAGGTYAGPKTILIDKAFDINIDKLQGWLK